MLDKQSILAAHDITTEDVPVPEWGGNVRVRVITAAEREAFSASLVDATGKADTSGFKAKLVARCMVDEAGNRLFEDADVDQLQAKSSAAIERIFQVADRLNKISNDTIDQAAKN